MYRFKMDVDYYPEFAIKKILLGNLIYYSDRVELIGLVDNLWRNFTLVITFSKGINDS